ncbi:MAG TPA: DUF1028 domain-containing protein, partial [Acidimicrobiales bacterium]
GHEQSQPRGHRRRLSRHGRRRDAFGVTYSVVARDDATGELGVAVQSHFFSVGSVVSWARPGVGAVATQSMADITYGPLGLELLAGGRGATDALAGLLAADEGRASRQVAIVDAGGDVAVHTGSACIPDAGHRTGDGFSVQANMMARATVWDAMAEAFATATGDVADRMLAALDAAEAEGGDIRGKQSAALVVVSGDRTRPWWERVLDVRVDDSLDPLAELRRLVGLNRAYAGRGTPDALGANPELRFWQAMRLVHEGHVDEARASLDRIYAVHDGWRELVRRLPASGRLPDDPELIARLTQ